MSIVSCLIFAIHKGGTIVLKLSAIQYLVVLVWVLLCTNTTSFFAARVPAEHRYAGQAQVTFVLRSGESFVQETLVTKLTAYAGSHFIILCEHGEVVESRLGQAPLELDWDGDYHTTLPDEVPVVRQGLCRQKEGYDINVTLASEGEVAARLLFYEGRVDSVKSLYWVVGILVLVIGLWWYLLGSKKAE